jgi:hypothetical protein
MVGDGFADTPLFGVCEKADGRILVLSVSGGNVA